MAYSRATRPRLTRFLTDQSGAVTVDWTVLTAAIVGLGVASAAAVRTGTSNLGGDIEASLSGAGVADLTWAFARDLVSQNFGNGDFSGWSLARAGTFGAWGDMQGPFGFDTMTNPLTFDVALPSGMKDALIQFDMVISDTWDGLPNANNPWTHPGGDTMSLLINGTPISVEAFVYHGGHPGAAPELFQSRSSTVEIDGATYKVSMTPKNLPTANIAGIGTADQRWSVQVEALGAPSNFQLGFSAALDQRNLNDEAFGIQNFNIKGK
jgi:Flp pilus assembly pilin Flp